MNCDLHNGEAVEIHTVNEVLKTSIEEIRCYKENLDFALSGLSCGLAFTGISHMQFRVGEPIVNPFDPKTQLPQFLSHDGKENVAEGVYVFKEADEEPEVELFKIVEVSVKVYIKMLTSNERVWSGHQWAYRFVRTDNYPTNDEKYATDFKTRQAAEQWIKDHQPT